MSKSRSESEDFKKLNERETKNFTIRSNRKTIISFITCFAVLVLSLTVFLPMSIANKDNDLSFGYSGEFYPIIVDDLDQLADEYGLRPTVIPTIDNNIDHLIEAFKLYEDDSIVGGSADYGLCDEYFDNVDMSFYVLGSNSSTYNIDFTEPVVWQGKTLYYRIKETELIDLTQYNLDVYFKDENYEYHIKIQYFKEFEVAELMDMFYKVV